MKTWVVRSMSLVGVCAAVCILSLPRALPLALAWSRSDVLFRGEADTKRLFLTIDDAPSDSTSAILAVLKKHNVPATFFIIGNRVQSDAQLLNIVEAGYSLGHHMRTTDRCSKLPIDRFRADFDFTDHLLRRFAVPGYFRPPSD